MDDLSVDIDFNEFAEGLEKHLWSLEQFKPAEIVIENDHARYVEYGSGPVQTHTPQNMKMRDLGNGHMEELTDMQYNLYRWIERANNKKLSVHENLHRMFCLYKKICEEGVRPTPFITPAVQMAREDLVDNLSQGMTLYEIAEQTADTMIQILRDKPVVSSEGDPETKSILESISVRYMDPDDIDNVEDEIPSLYEIWKGF